eukprot:TRINITY_DN23800_c0_g4_i4.p1 TRINITY_DN23800_c0_g4~~TRINITY_DN23800_c0_g4_i4.p1  ORF type:complete len:503 (+),score=111.91 TRINITY_DN23800_c0_g4_i4:109-1617(+)
MATSSAAAGAGDGKTRFLGVIKSVAVAAGYGFIESREAAAICGTDVFLDKRHARGLPVGQKIAFFLYFSSRGKARARDVAPIEQGGQHQALAKSATPSQECLAEWQKGAAAVRDEEADSRVQLLCSISGQVGALAVRQQTHSNEAAAESAAERSRLAAEAAGLRGALKQAAAAADRAKLEAMCATEECNVREEQSAAWSTLLSSLAAALTRPAPLPTPTPQPSGRARRRAQRRRRRRASAAMQAQQRTPQPQGDCFQLGTPQKPDSSPEEPTLRSAGDADVRSDGTEEYQPARGASRGPSGVVPPPLLSECPEEEAEEHTVAVRNAEATAAAAEEAPCTPAHEAILIDHVLYWVTVHVPYKSRANWARVCSDTCRASIGVMHVYAGIWAWVFDVVGVFRSRGPECPFDVGNFDAVVGPVAAARAELLQLKTSVRAVPGHHKHVNWLLILCDFALVLYEEIRVKHLELVHHALWLNNTVCDFTEGLEALLEEHSLRTEADDAQ